MSAADLRPHHPGLRARRLLLLAEIRSVVRDTAGLVVPLGMPPLILLMYGVQADDAVVDDSGATYLEAFGLPMVIAMVLALVGVVNMPSFLATYRSTGVLRRLGVTPLSPSAVLVAQVLTSALQSMLGVGIALLLAATVFDTALPRALGWGLLTLVLAALGMYGLGMVVAALAPTPNASVALGLVVFFAIGAVGGMFGPASALPDVVAEVGAWLPFGATTEALGSAWVGEAPDPRRLVAVASTAVIGLFVAARAFRWER